MFHSNPYTFLRGTAGAFAAFCLAAAPTYVFAQAGTIPPGAPETAPTTLQGNPAPAPALPPNPVTSSLPVATSMTTPTGDLGLSLTPHFDSTGKPNGAFVSSVNADGPGARAGIQPADLITTLDEQPVTDADQLTALAAAQAPGSAVKLSVQRNGTSQAVSVQLGQTPQAALGQVSLATSGIDYGSPPFTGSYKAKYRADYVSGTGITRPQTGTLTLTISSGGTVTGSIHADTGGLDGIVAGTLSGTGNVSLAFTFTAGASGTINGTLTNPAKGRLGGSLVQSFGPDPSGTLTLEAGK